MDKKLTDKWLKEIREKISCPQFGNEHYGEWGILTLNQRRTIKRLLDFIEAQEEYINRLQAENERLKNAYKQCAWERDCFEADNKRLYEIIENKGGSILIANAKAEAYKEFAEMLKEKAKPHYFDNCNFAVPIEDIDNLLKEMVGDK